MPKHLVEPGFWIKMLTEDGMTIRVLDLFRACAKAFEVDTEATVAYRNINKVARPDRGARPSLGGEEHIKAFLQVSVRGTTSTR